MLGNPSVSGNAHEAMASDRGVHDGVVLAPTSRVVGPNARRNLYATPAVNRQLLERPTLRKSQPPAIRREERASGSLSADERFTLELIERPDVQSSLCAVSPMCSQSPLGAVSSRCSLPLARPCLLRAPFQVRRTTSERLKTDLTNDSKATVSVLYWHPDIQDDHFHVYRV